MSWTLLQQEDNKIQAPLEAGEAPCESLGEEVQKLSVIESLPLLLQEDESQCMQRIVPKVQQILPNASTEFQLAASSTFRTILQMKLVQTRTFTQTFLQSILSSIDSRDPMVASAWLETLLEVIGLLPKNVIKSEILPVAISKGQIAQSISSRLTACKLLGKMATKFESYELKKEVLPLIHSLCQDVNYEVRACICSQLHYVAQTLDAESIKLSLLPCLVELASDEESYVRLAAVETIVHILNNLQSDSIKYTIIPLVKKMCEQSLRAEDIVMVKISEHFGKLCQGLEGHFTLQEKQWMLRHYQKMAELGLPKVKSHLPLSSLMPDVVPDQTENHIACRQNCALNFPGITHFCLQTGSLETFAQQLYPTFQDLAGDPYFMIRQTIACGLNDVAQALSKGSAMLKPEVIKLLRDDAEEVLQGLVPHIGNTLVQLSKSGVMSPESMDTAVLDVGRALLKCEAEISSTTNWRLHAQVLGQLECLPHCIPSDFIFSHFIPIIFNRIKTARPVPCRMAAARTMLVFLRYNTKQTQKNEILTRIDKGLRTNESCYKRMLYVKMCATAIDLYSRHYFKDHFFLPLLALADDRVPNIRLKLVTLLPKLKAMIHLPTDRKLLTALESCVRNLLSQEKDRDVMSQLRLTIQALDAIEVQLELGSLSAMSREEDDDRRKTEEESLLLSGGIAALTRRKGQNQNEMKKSYSVKTPTISSPGQKKGLAASSSPIRPITGRHHTGFSSAQVKSPLTNLEDEFYVDAGIRIPQQLAASDFVPLPSRIPNLREILFKNRTTSSTVSTNSQTVSHSSPQKELKPESPSEPGNSNMEVKSGFSAVTKTSNMPVVSKLTTSVAATPKKTFIPSNINKRNSGNFSTKSEYQTQSISKSKLSLVNKQKPAANVTVTNRRHSYMEGDKVFKMKSSEIVEGKKVSVISENRRHSYLERIQVSTSENSVEKNSDAFAVKKVNARSQTLPESKFTTTVTNRRHSYNSAAQNNRVDSEVPVMRRGAASNRHSLGPDTRKSLLNSQSQIKRGTSLDRETGTEIAGSNVVKRRSLIAPSTVKHTVRRHSSLERDDVDRLSVRTRVQGKKVENKFFSGNVQKELMMFSTSGKTVGEKMDIRKAECNRNTQREFHSLDDVGTSCKGNRVSKIPRGGGTSCHSSPGNSRASSPTILICGSSNRLRQRTAPNSRASSPTGSEKLQQRLSLGSLNCYMGNMKLSEPGMSRLPVRNLSHPR